MSIAVAEKFERMEGEKDFDLLDIDTIVYVEKKDEIMFLSIARKF